MSHNAGVFPHDAGATSHDRSLMSQTEVRCRKEAGQTMILRILRAVLSGWFLLLYFGVGVIFFVAFPGAVSWIEYTKSLTVTLGLLTGSDPYSFKEIVEPHAFLWGLAWVIHVASWLFIPALIALVIADAKEDINKERSLKDGLNQLARELKIKNEKIPEVTNTILGEIETWLKEKGSE